MPKQSDATIVDGRDGAILLSQQYLGLYVGAIPLNAQVRLADAR